MKYCKNELSIFAAYGAPYEEVDKLFGNYENKLAEQVIKSLEKSIIRVYSMGACPV